MIVYSTPLHQDARLAKTQETRPVLHLVSPGVHRARTLVRLAKLRWCARLVTTVLLLSLVERPPLSLGEKKVYLYFEFCVLCGGGSDADGGGFFFALGGGALVAAGCGGVLLRATGLGPWEPLRA